MMYAVDDDNGYGQYINIEVDICTHNQSRYKKHKLKKYLPRLNQLVENPNNPVKSDMDMLNGIYMLSVGITCVVGFILGIFK
jgi:hypothetical protein